MRKVAKKVSKLSLFSQLSAPIKSGVIVQYNTATSSQPKGEGNSSCAKHALVFILITTAALACSYKSLPPQMHSFALLFTYMYRHLSTLNGFLVLHSQAFQSYTLQALLSNTSCCLTFFSYKLPGGVPANTTISFYRFTIFSPNPAVSDALLFIFLPVPVT